MLEIDKFVKLYTTGLKSMAKAILTLAEKVEEIGNAMAEAASTQEKAEKPKEKAKKAEKPKAKPRAKKTVKKSAAKEEKKATASGTVLSIIEASKNGADYKEIMEKTGFDRKKTANIIFNLNKQGKIKTVKRGVYTKS